MKLFVNFSGRIDGNFLVRNSVNGGSDSPYTLTVYYQKRIYNLNIRLLPQGKCVLGKKKINEVVSTYFQLCRALNKACPPNSQIFLVPST